MQLISEIIEFASTFPTDFIVEAAASTTVNEYEKN